MVFHSIKCKHFSQVKMQVRKIQEYLVSMFNTRGIYRYQKYFLRYVFCEFLTLANLVIQIGLIDRFLGGMFTIYGPMVFEISSQDPEDRDDPMNLVFPKVRHISWTCQTNKGHSC